MQKNISVILSTKKKSERLKKVLLGYNAQTYRNFELIVVFEDLDKETNSWITKFKEEVFYTIKEVYPNADSLVLIHDLSAKVETDYVVFASGNSIPRFDFIEQHVKNKEEGFFLVGAINSISEEVFNKINQQDIYSGNCFELSWLKSNGNKNNFQDRLRHFKGVLGTFLNFIFKDNLKFNSDNASVWKKDFIFKNENLDENYFHDLSNTLQKRGIKAKQIKYSTVLIG